MTPWSVFERKVVVDVDGVLADFWNTYQERFGKRDHYNVESNPAEDEFWKNPPYEFWANLPCITPVSLFEEAMKGYKVVFYSSCPHSTARSDWLVKRGFMNEERTLLCNAVNTSKVNGLNVIQPFAFIDDFGKNIEEADKHCFIPFLFKFDNKNVIESWTNIKMKLQKDYYDFGNRS